MFAFSTNERSGDEDWDGRGDTGLKLNWERAERPQTLAINSSIASRVSFNKWHACVGRLPTRTVVTINTFLEQLVRCGVIVMLSEILRSWEGRWTNFVSQHPKWARYQKALE